MNIRYEKKFSSPSTSQVLRALSATTEVHHQNPNFNVPNIIHFIWAGGSTKPPDEYIKSMLIWQEGNPSSQIFFWVDKKTSGEELISSYSKLFKEMSSILNTTNKKDGTAYQADPLKIKIMDIEEEEKHSNDNYKISNDFVRYEIDRLKPNYGASSDLLRYRIMYKYGGAYFDFDIRTGALILDKEIFQKVYPTHQLWLYPFSQNSNSIGNDAFICTPSHPYMAFIYEIAESNYRIGADSTEKQNIINALKLKAQNLGVKFNENSNEFKVISSALNLVSDLHGYDDNKYIFGVTPIKTGPSCVRAAVAQSISFNSDTDNSINAGENSKFELDAEDIEELTLEGDVIPSMTSTAETSLISSEPTLILLKRGDIVPFPQSGLTWINQDITKYTNLSNAIQDAMKSIQFEINVSGYLRLDDHINNIASASKSTQQNTSLMLLEQLNNAQIDYGRIRAVQYTFQHPELSIFYDRYHLNYRDSFLPKFDDVDTSYQVPILQILSISSVNRIKSTLFGKPDLAHLEEKNATDCYVIMLRGIQFVELALVHVRSKLNTDLPIEMQQNIANYLNFLQDQLAAYIEFTDEASKTLLNNDSLEHVKNTLHKAIIDLAALLEPLKIHLNHEDIDFDDIPIIPQNAATDVHIARSWHDLGTKKRRNTDCISSIFRS